MPTAVVVVLAAAAAIALGCGAEEPATSRIFLITIDTLRPDHLSAYGYPYATDPVVRRLAEEGVLFRDASSTSSWTAPALASLHTSLHPYQHGVREGSVREFAQGKPYVVMQPVLPGEIHTLAEILAQHGYATHALTTSPHTTKDLGFAQGFDSFQRLLPEEPDPASGRVYVDARELARRSAELAARLRGAGRVFVWLHWLDPHHPYVGREPWLGEFRGDGGGRRPVLARRPSVQVASDEQRVAARRRLVPLYDSEIRYVTDSLGTVLDELGAGPEDFVIVTSDHGEAFYENGYWGHSVHLFDRELRVPLVMRFPESQGLGGIVESPVSLLDVAPTILDVVGIAPDAALEGRSLLPLVRGSAAAADRPLFAEHWRHGHRLRAVRLGRWKLIHDERSGQELFFDLSSDPDEQHDLVSAPTLEAAAALDDLRGHLHRQRVAAATTASARQRAADPEDARQLRSLGYVD